MQEYISYNHLGDRLNFLKRLPDKCIDWVVDDFPYGIGADKMGYTRKQIQTKLQSNGSRLNVKMGNYHKGNWDHETPTQEYFDEIVRVSHNQIMFGIEYVEWNGVGPGRIRWNKMVADGATFKKYELAYCSSISHTHEIKLLHSGMMQAKSISEPTVMQGNKKLNEKKIHNTQKPILLYDIIYRDFIQPGSIVLDPNLGSGSNRISARKWGVHFIGCEIDPIMHAKEEIRFIQYISQTKLPFF